MTEEVEARATYCGGARTNWARGPVDLIPTSKCPSHEQDGVSHIQAAIGPIADSSHVLNNTLATSIGASQESLAGSLGVQLPSMKPRLGRFLKSDVAD